MSNLNTINIKALLNYDKKNIKYRKFLNSKNITLKNENSNY